MENGKSRGERMGKPAGKDKLPRKGKRGIFAKKRTKKPVGKDKLPTQRENPQRGVPLPENPIAFRCGGKIILTEKKNGKVSVGERKRTGLPRKGKTRKGEFRCRPLEERFVAGEKLS